MGWKLSGEVQEPGALLLDDTRRNRSRAQSRVQHMESAMPTSVEKISAGITAALAPDAGAIPLARLRGAPATSSAINALFDETGTKSRRLADLCNGLTKHMTAFEESKRAEVGALPREVSQSARAKILRDALKRERRDKSAISSAERTRLAAELRDAKARVEATASLFTPLSLLKRGALGSAKAATYRAALASAGAVEVEEALTHAALTGDRDLAAAAIARLDASKSVRQGCRISKSEVAEALCGAEATRAKRNALGVEIAAESGLMAFNEAEGRDVPSVRRFTLGMKRQEFARLNAIVEGRETPEGGDS
jgi:hypothetical protein